jgi:hypothetical protein
MSLHGYIRANSGFLAFGAAFLTFTASASAETHDLTCNSAGSSSNFQLTVDPDEGFPALARTCQR